MGDTGAIVTSPAPTTVAEARRAPFERAALLGVVLFVVALNLRAAIAGVPPLVQTIRADLGLSAALAGVLTTIPVLCMGFLAPLAQRVAARTGREGAIAVALALLVVGQVVRLGGAHLSLLLLGTFLAGVGISTAGVVLPSVVKDFFPHRAGLLTGVTMFAMMFGAAVAAALAVPLADGLGSWQRSLAVWALPAAIALAAWLPVVRRVNAHARTASARGRLPWGSAAAWLVATYMAVQSVEFYTELAWLAPTFEDSGMSARRAGLLLSVFALSQVVSGLGGPVLADRMADRRPLLAAAVVLALVGLGGMALAPDLSPWLWALLLGLGQGAGFALCLVMVVSYAPTPPAAARLTAMVYLVAYGCAAVGPVVFGALRDSSGGFHLPWALFASVAVLQLVVVPAMRPGRTSEPAPAPAGTTDAVVFQRGGRAIDE